MHNDIRFICHDRFNDKFHEINASAVREVIGDFVFDRLVAGVGRGAYSSCRNAVDFNGFVFEAVRIP